MASRPPLSRRHCSASTPPKCLPSGSVSTPLLSRACVGTASSEALAAGRRIRAAAPQTWPALRGGPDAKDLAADGGTESSNPSPSSEESCELRCRRRNRARGAASDPIATHIAARGIDVDGVSPVINFDLPNETSATLVIPGVQNRRQHQRQPLSAVIRLSSAERSLRALLDR